MLDKIKDMNNKLKLLQNMKDRFGLRKLETRSSPQVLETTPPALEPHVLGRDQLKEQMVEALTSDELAHCRIKPPVLPIVARGGAGKTTLCRLVFDDDGVKKHFDSRIWVWVSRDFDPVRILKGIVTNLRGAGCIPESLQELQVLLQISIERKRFLLILEDVWNGDNGLWEQVLAPLRSGKDGSIVVVTTRSRDVAVCIPGHFDPHDLHRLRDECIWTILENFAFGGRADPTKHERLIPIGKEVVEKLRGSPLAAKMIGGLLSKDLCDDHWKGVLKSELWSVDVRNREPDILPSLKVSYQHLPPHLKQCFKLWSMFPQDHVFASPVDDMRLGYLFMALDATPEDHAADVIDDLLSRSLLRRDEDGNVTMHDLVRDALEHVAQDDSLHVVANGVYPEKNPSKVRHLSLSKVDWNRESQMLDAPFRYEKLRSLLIRDVEHGSRTYPVISCHVVGRWLEIS